MIYRKLLEIFEEEKARLGIRSKVNLNILERHLDCSLPIREFLESCQEQSSGVLKIERGHYLCEISEIHVQNSERFRGLARHELYHIAAGHCETRCGLPFWRNLILEIPATLYQLGLIEKPRYLNSR